MRLIDADALRGRMVNGNDKITIDCAPTIDAVPVVHGRWIPCEYRPTLYCKCSECGRMKEWLENMEWCPHCGAKMDKKEPT